MIREGIPIGWVDGGGGPRRSALGGSCNGTAGYTHVSTRGRLCKTEFGPRFRDSRRFLCHNGVVIILICLGARLKHTYSHHNCVERNTV